MEEASLGKVCSYVALSRRRSISFCLRYFVSLFLRKISLAKSSSRFGGLCPEVSEHRRRLA